MEVQVLSWAPCCCLPELGFAKIRVTGRGLRPCTRVIAYPHLASPRWEQARYLKEQAARQRAERRASFDLFDNIIKVWTYDHTKRIADETEKQTRLLKEAIKDWKSRERN